MFYSQYVLAKKGPLGKIWLAAHMDKKLPKVQVIATSIPESVDHIENPQAPPHVPMALRMSGHLLLGVVRIFSRKVNYLFSDCSEAMVKIKDAFRGPGGVDLAPGAATRRYDDITNPEQFDEMDLDAGFDSQGMSFVMDDDALAGITVPEDALGDITMNDGFGFDEGGGGGFEAESGFGQNENFEVFFDKGNAPEMPAEKRQRTSQPAASQLDEQDEEEDEEELPEMERSRSAAEPLQSEVHDPYMGAAGVADADAGDFGAPGVFEAFEEPMVSGMDEVMAEDAGRATRRSSVGASSVAASQPDEEGASQGAAKQASRKAPKRKIQMLLDEQIQISSEIIKKNIADTSAIVRDLVAEANAKMRAPPPDLFSGPPDLSLLPPEALELECFLPSKLNIIARKQQRAKPAGPQPTTNADADEAQLGEEEPLGEGMGDEAQLFGEEPMQFDEEPFEQQHADEVQQQEEQEQPSPVAAFDASQRLPDVDDHEVSEKDKDAGGSQSSADTWSARTQKMHAMLDRSFTESDGQALSFDAMVAKSRGPQKRRVVAGCFQELLFLSTHGLVDLQQHMPYGNIVISKTDHFDSVTVRTSTTPAAAAGTDTGKTKGASGRRSSRGGGR